MVTIATLEARARINRTEWQQDRSALASDIQGLNAQLDILSAKFTSITAQASAAGQRVGTSSVAQATSRLTQGTSVDPGLTASTQGANQAAEATQRLTAAQREAIDPTFALAKAIQQSQNDYRLYVRTLGEAHPVTRQAKADLEEMSKSASSSAVPALTFQQHMDRLAGAMQNTSTQSGGLRQQLSALMQGLTQGESAVTGFGRGILQSVGGISLIAGGAAAAGAAVAGLAQQLVSMAQQAIVAGIAGNAGMEQYQTSFKVLLGSAYDARQRIAELTQFANTTPFNMPEVVRADRVLQTFGGTALATGKNLSLIGDIASGTNQRFEDVAMWTGRAYDALQSGRPWGEAAMRLQEMGALSGQARQRLEDLQASGASGQKVWAAFTQEMSRFNGMMQEQSKTASGLASTYQDLQSSFLRTATRPIFDDYKAFLQAATSSSGQSALNTAANDTAKAFGVAIPIGLGLAIAAFKPFIAAGHEAIGMLTFLDEHFGVFGHTIDGTADKLTKAANTMSVGSHHAFSDIGDTVREQAGAVRDAANSMADAADAAARRTAAAMSASLRAVQSASRGGEGGPRDSRAETAGYNAPPPPGFRSWAEFNEWNSAHNQIIDATSAAISQAGLARQQANDQQYLTAQLSAQNAQALATAAIDRLKISDQTFLQGQVSAQITSTQIQTAIDRVKLGNTQLMDASIQADAAQAQVQNAINRIRGNNSLLISASVEADTISSQAQAALTRAKGQSQAYVQSQVEAAKAQRATQDAIDNGLKAAGLIDETGAEKRAHEKQISAIDFVKSQVQGAYDVVKTGLDAAQQLSHLTIPSNLDTKIQQFARLEDAIIQGEQDVAKRYSKDVVSHLYSFSQAAHEGVNLFADGVKALSDLSRIDSVLPSQADVDRVLGQSFYIVAALEKQSAGHKIEQLGQLSNYADSALKAMQTVSATADAFSKLANNRVDVTGQINLLFDNMAHAIKLFSAYSARWKNEATDETTQVATNVGTVMENLNKALDPITKFQAAGEVGDYEIDAAIHNVDYALRRMGALADSPLMQGASLLRLQNASATIGSLFSGLKGAIDTLTGLKDMADSTDTVDIGSGLDQLFLVQAPAWADSWETAMNRVGNATEAAGKRVAGALGAAKPGAIPSARAGAGSGGTVNYILQVGSVDFSKDPVIEDLMRKMFDHINLVQGGVQVGR